MQWLCQNNYIFCKQKGLRKIRSPQSLGAFFQFLHTLVSTFGVTKRQKPCYINITYPTASLLGKYSLYFITHYNSL